MKSISIIIVFLPLLLAGELQAQAPGATKRMNHLLSLLPVECHKGLANSANNTVECKISGRVIPIRARFSSQGEIEHVGISLTGNDHRLLNDQVIVDYVERSLLDLTLDYPSSDYAKLPDGRVRYTLNDRVLSTVDQKNEMLDLLQSTGYRLGFRTDSKSNAVFLEDKLFRISLSIPKEYSERLGMDKRESSLKLKEEIVKYRSGKAKPPCTPSGTLYKYKDVYHVSPGKTVFRVFNTNVFYDCANTTCRPISDRSLPYESLSNLFLCAIADTNSRRMKVIHHVYPNEKREYMVALKDFKAYMEVSHDAFFGLEGGDDELMNGVVVYQSKADGFFNLLTMKASKEWLFVGGTIECHLYTYIPSDNIKNLFAD